MENKARNGIQYMGVSRNIPEESTFFGEVTFFDTIDISNCKGTLKSIISATIDCKIISTKIIDTIKGRGNDGTVLLGNKLIVDGEYTLKIEYVTNTSGNAIFTNFYKYSKFGEITVPPKINGENIKDLNRRKKLRVTPYVDDLYVAVVRENMININVNIILDLDGRIKSN